MINRNTIVLANLLVIFSAVNSLSRFSPFFLKIHHFSLLSHWIAVRTTNLALFSEVLLCC